MSSTAHIAPEDSTALIDGDLTAEARASTEAHLAQCESCRTEHRELHGLVSLLGGLPRYEPPRNFTLTREHIPGVRGARGMLRFLPVVRGFSVAAVVAFVTVTGLMILDRTNIADDLAGIIAPIFDTGTGTPSDASKQITGDSDADTNGLIERGDSAASNSAPVAPSSGEPAAAAADTDDLAQTTASPGAGAAVPVETPVSVATTVGSDDDDRSWLMTSFGLGALAIVLIGLWTVLVRMGRPRRQTA